jgi:hypothetical protein
MVLWWKRPDLMLHPSGVKTWEVRANSPRGRAWLHHELHEQADIVICPHDAALEVVFRAVRDGLIVCSDPTP